MLLANLASMVFGFAMFAMSRVLPQLLQMPKATGFGLGQRTRGPKVTLMVGALVVAAG